jgi:bacterioferritin-associated ferredoxin
MYVCICNGVTDKDIRQAAEAGCKTVAELTMRTGAGATCGTCLDMVADLLAAARPRDPSLELPVLQAA